ncbi:methionine adenosyltransferase [Tropheryma whipplei]|uniref:methionine adenosyltransferase n=1 Tax=Tropheryma whipplei TaxID=2039 RepID=UPI0004B40497|nr:methionine adenosyltransferase [Tropheryma whipplei]
MILTSESVTEGHPDKLCDQISDAILDGVICKDKNARAGIETIAGNGVVHVFGEVSNPDSVDIPGIIRKTILDIGYTSEDAGIDGNTCSIQESITSQSKEIADAVNFSLEYRNQQGDLGRNSFSQQGSGDQGSVFGYACRETPEMMPLPITIAHKLAYSLAFVRKEKILPYLLPDGKSQVTLGYDSANRPKTLETVVISAQHEDSVDLDKLRFDILERVVRPVISATGLDCRKATFLINPAGRFVTGGPSADSGLTGRKIVVDTYGCAAKHGGGALSGKDPSKLDRFASYMARWVAKHVVAADFAESIEVQISYAIGKAHPVAFNIDTHGTSTIALDKLKCAILKVFDFRPAAVIDSLDLKRPIYQKTAAYGHFGRDIFTWERICPDKLNALLGAV